MQFTSGGTRVRDDNEIHEIQGTKKSYYYTLVGSIPITFHSADLRNYFAKFIKEQRFNCFHFRHRPQSIRIGAVKLEPGQDTTNAAMTVTESTVEPLYLSSENPIVQPSSRSSPGVVSDAPAEANEGTHAINITTNDHANQNCVKKFCALVRFTNEHDLKSFIKFYHGKYWMDKAGNELHGRCMIRKVRLDDTEIMRFSKELHPPRFMPHGNVGTSNEYFLNLIKECRLPPSLIKKLGLEFPNARRYKKYSKVPLDYGTNVVKGDSDDDEIEIVTAKGHTLSDVILPTTATTGASEKENANESPARPDEEDTDRHANDDDDNCEEWERHEALHNDVTSQERAKERLYEEEIELVWEKGGSGLLFYTDAQYWDEQEGGFDEKTADDLDVDMEGYYEEGGGDKDARDLMNMRRSQRFKKGLEEISVFRRKQSRSPSPTPCSSSSLNKKIGEFEAHTKGFGRKLMEKQGWTDGRGLGVRANMGIAEALEGDGQEPRDKTGLGYYGEKITFSGKRKRPKHSNANNPYGLDEDDRVVIGTIYDKPAELDKEEPLLRSNAPTFIKRYNFVKPKQS